MAKKDFTAAASSRRVYESIEQATAEPQLVRGKNGAIREQPAPQQPADGDEIAERQATMTTQGRRGCKSPRINMAFSSDNYDFIKAGAAATGLNMTQFTNLIIDRYRQRNPEIMDKFNALQELKDSL